MQKSSLNRLPVWLWVFVAAFVAFIWYPYARMSQHKPVKISWIEQKDIEFWIPDKDKTGWKSSLRIVRAHYRGAGDDSGQFHWVSLKREGSMVMADLQTGKVYGQRLDVFRNVYEYDPLGSFTINKGVPEFQFVSGARFKYLAPQPLVFPSVVSLEVPGETLPELSEPIHADSAPVAVGETE